MLQTWYNNYYHAYILLFTYIHAALHTLEKASLTELNNGTILIMWDPIMVGGENTALMYRITISNSSNNLVTKSIAEQMSSDGPAIYSYSFDPENLNSNCETFRVSITPIINDHYPGGPTILIQGNYNRFNEVVLTVTFNSFIIAIPPVHSITSGGVTFVNNSLDYIFVLPVSEKSKTN